MTESTTSPLKMMFHPTLHVTSLDESEEFFDRVFRRPSPLLEVMPRNDWPDPATAPKGYSRFTSIADVLFDSVNPSLHVTDGVQHFKSPEKPTLFNFGWYVYDIYETFRILKSHGIPMMSQFGTPADGDEPPLGDQGGGDLRQIYMPADKIGIRYQFMPPIKLHVDPRTEDGWSLPEVSDADPLGIVRHAVHTVLTDQPERALHLVVDALGGEVIHEGRDEARGVAGPFVHLADGVIHYATPEPGSPLAKVLAAKSPADVYHALTFQVVDLPRAAGHLEEVGVRIENRTEDTIVTDTATGLGVPWGFTTKLVPGDPRGR